MYILYMPKKKDTKKNKVIVKRVKKNNVNVNNSIKINIGTTKSKRTGSKSNNKNVQHSSAPYPVYNKAVQYGPPPPNIINNIPQPLQRQDNFNQKDLTNVRDELLKRMSEPLLLKYDAELVQKMKDDQELQDRKDAQRQFEKEQRRMEKEAIKQQEQYQQRERDNWNAQKYNQLLNYNDILEKKINLLGYKVDENNNFFNNLLKDQNNQSFTPQKQFDSSNVEGNTYSAFPNSPDLTKNNPLNNNNNLHVDNPFLGLYTESNKDQNVKELQQNTNNIIEPIENNTQFNNPASNILQVTKLSELGPNEFSIEINHDKVAQFTTQEDLKKLNQIINKNKADVNTEKLFYEYEKLYEEFYNHPIENNINLEHYKNMGSTANATLSNLIKHFKKEIDKKKNLEVQSNFKKIADKLINKNIVEGIKDLKSMKQDDNLKKLKEQSEQRKKEKEDEKNKVKKYGLPKNNTEIIDKNKNLSVKERANLLNNKK